MLFKGGIYEIYKKYKRIIAFALCFNLMFYSISNYNSKKVEAFDFIITPTLLWALGSLVTATGIIALNHEQVLDMGEKVWDRMEYREGNMVYDIVNGAKRLIGIKADKQVIDAVSSVAIDLPTERVNKKSSEVTSSDSTMLRNIDFSSIVDHRPFGISVTNSQTSAKWFYDNANFDYSFNVATSSKSTTLSIPEGGLNLKANSTYEARIGSYFANTDPSLFDFRFGYLVIKGITGGDIDRYYLTSFRQTDFTVSAPNGFITDLYSNTVIPYDNPVVRTGYNEGLISDELPYSDDIPGVITIPQSVPTDIPISTDIPYDWEKAKEIIKPKVEDGLIEDEIIFPGGSDEIELPNDLSLWGWLKALLGLFLKGLNAIFDVIKSILDFITGFIGKLVRAFGVLLYDLLQPVIEAIKGIGGQIVNLFDIALTGAIKGLFFPTVVITDLFPPISDTGFGKLSDVLDFSALFDTPVQAYSFNTDLNFDYITGNHNYNLDVDFKEFTFLEKNINLIRNLTSYPLLIASVWFVVKHLLPKREVD